MIDTETELFTAVEAVEVGLPEAIYRGETKIEGSYELGKDLELRYKQRNFVFTDKFGGLRTGKFKDSEELLNFFAELE